jgi:prophage regulatory protein
MSERLLRVTEVMARTGLSRPTIYRWMAAGQFPKPVPLGRVLVAWPESAISAFIAETVQASRGEDSAA